MPPSHGERVHRLSCTLCILYWLSARSSFHRPTCSLRNRLYIAAKMTSIHLPYSIRSHLIVNGLRQLMCISKAVRAQSPLCCLLTGISPPRFHKYSDAILTSDDNRDCTIHLPVYFFYCSAVIFWRGVLSYHNHFICTSVPHKMLSDFSFAKLAQAAFCKGRAPRLV